MLCHVVTSLNIWLESIKSKNKNKNSKLIIIPLTKKKALHISQDNYITREDNIL